MSSCCGALDYIVVDTADTAKQCVKYIRDKGLGVATFLILKQQEHLAGQAAQKIKTPQGALILLAWPLQLCTSFEQGTISALIQTMVVDI